MRKLSTGTGAQYLRPYLKHDDVEVKPSLLGLYSVMGTLEPWMEVNFKLCQGSKCNQSVDFLKWHQISEGDRLISTITFWRSKTNPFSRRRNSRISRFFIFINLNSWKDWIMKLLVLWFIRGFFQDDLDGKDTRLSSIQW